VKLLVACLCIPGLLAAQDAREIVRRACQFDEKNTAASRNYTYLQHQVDVDFDGNGQVKTKQVRTWDVTMQDGSPYRRLVARNDQPLSDAEQKFEADKLQANIELRRKETAAQREHRIAEWDKRRDKQHEPVKELPDAFDFKIAGEEAINGGQAWVIDATPKPGYHPKSTSTAFFPKVKGRLWIDKQDYQWIKVEMETTGPVSFGGFIVRLQKGGHLIMEQTRVNSEVWLPKRVWIDASARIVLVKGFHKSLDITFSDYKKFQADARMVATQPIAR